MGQCMGAVFGRARAPARSATPKPQPPALTAAETAQLELRRTRDRIMRFERRLQQEIEALVGRAREALARGDKDGCLR